MGDVTQPFGGNPSLSPRYSNSRSPMTVREFCQRVARARHGVYLSAISDPGNLDDQLKVVINPDTRAEVIYDFKSNYRFGDTPITDAPFTVFGIPVLTDSSVPMGKILLRVEVEA